MIIDYRKLQAEILANPACIPFVHTNEMEPISGAEAIVKDQAIADVLNVGRKRLASHMISERGIRNALAIHDAALFLRTLRDLSTASALPVGIAQALIAMGVAEAEHWAYLDTLQCAWEWLKGDGLELGTAKTVQLLQLIGAGIPETAQACQALIALAYVDDKITAADVSRAVRGPWE